MDGNLEHDDDYSITDEKHDMQDRMETQINIFCRLQMQLSEVYETLEQLKNSNTQIIYKFL